MLEPWRGRKTLLNQSIDRKVIGKTLVSRHGIGKWWDPCKIVSLRTTAAAQYRADVSPTQATFADAGPMISRRDADVQPIIVQRRTDAFVIGPSQFGY